MSTNLKDEIKIPINWDSIFKYSGVILLTLFVVALIFKIKSLIILSEILGGVLVLTFIMVGFCAALNKFGTKKNK